MTRTLACSVDDCSALHYGKGFCQMHYRRWYRHGDPLATFYGSDEITYKGAHLRIESIRGKADQRDCHHCGGKARQWAYDHSDPNERIGVVKGFSLAYSPDPNRYIPLCVPCHRTFDSEEIRSD